MCLKSESSTSKLEVSVGLLTSGINGAVTEVKTIPIKLLIISHQKPKNVSVDLFITKFRENFSIFTQKILIIRF